MVKKIVVLEVNQRQRNLHHDDIKTIFHFKRKKTPSLPSFYQKDYENNHKDECVSPVETEADDVRDRVALI